MKKLIYFIGVFILCLYSCANESENLPKEPQTNILEARKIARNYLIVTDEQYVLNLTIEQAQEIGISKNIYTQLIQEVEDSNLMLADLREKGKKITMLSPQKTEIRSLTPVKTRSEDAETIMEQGILKVENYQTTKYLYASYGAKSITFTGTTTCLISTISIKCNDYSDTITSGPWGGSCTFPIPSTPCTLYVTTYTLCSGGGNLGYIIYG